MIVTLNGHVVSDSNQWLYDWFGISAFSPGIVRKAVAENPADEDLVFEINSSGGSVFAGFEIYSILRTAKCHTVAHVQSLAASAASTVMVGCDEVMLSPVAQVMIHMPSTYTEGNQRAHRESLQALDSITQSILNGYELRCKEKADRARLEALMAAETWLPAQDAVELGLADGILYQEDPAACISTSVVNAVGGGIRSLANSGGFASPEELLAKYEQMVRDGAHPAEGHPVARGEVPTGPSEGTFSNNTPSNPTGTEPVNISDDWRCKARLAIENNRF